MILKIEKRFKEKWVGSRKREEKEKNKKILCLLLFFFITNAEGKEDRFICRQIVYVSCMYFGNHKYNLNDRLLGSCMESLNRSYWKRPYFRRLVSASKLSHYNHLVVAGGRG